MTFEHPSLPFVLVLILAAGQACSEDRSATPRRAWDGALIKSPSGDEFLGSIQNPDADGRADLVLVEPRTGSRTPFGRGRTTSARFLADGRSILSSGENDDLVLRSASSRSAARLAPQIRAGMFDYEFGASADGRAIAWVTQGERRELIYWDVAGSRQEKLAETEKRSSVQFLEDSSGLILASPSKTRIWKHSPAGWKTFERPATNPHSGDPLWSLAATRDGRLLALSSEDVHGHFSDVRGYKGSVVLWEPETGTEREVSSACDRILGFSSNGERLYLREQRIEGPPQEHAPRDLVVVDTASGVRTVLGRDVVSVRLSRDLDLVAFARNFADSAGRGDLVVYDGHANSEDVLERATKLLPFCNPFSYDGVWLAVSNRKAELTLINVRTRERRSIMRRPSCVTWSPDGGSVAVTQDLGSGAAGKLFVADLHSGKTTTLGETVYACVRYSPDGKWLAYLDEFDESAEKRGWSEASGALNLYDGTASRLVARSVATDFAISNDFVVYAVLLPWPLHDRATVRFDWCPLQPSTPDGDGPAPRSP